MTARIALAGWFGAGNLGDELILRSLVEEVRRRSMTPVAVSVHAEHTERDHGIEAVEHRSPLQTPKLLRALRSVDAVAVAGGLIQSETSPWNLPFHTSRIWAAKITRRPVVGVGLGVGRVPGAAGRALAVRSLRQVGSLSVRDSDSQRRLQNWGCKHAAIGVDPALGLRPEPVEADDTMCVILRPPNRRGLKTYAAKAASAWQHGLEKTAAAIDAVSAATGLTPRLMAFEARFDEELHAALADRLTVACETVTPRLDNVLAEVGRSRLVVTMRYHGAIAALLHQRPCVVLDYSPKMASLASEGGGWAPIIDPRHLDAGQLTNAASEALQSSAGASSTALQALRSRLAVNHDTLDSLLGRLR